MIVIALDPFAYWLVIATCVVNLVLSFCTWYVARLDRKIAKLKQEKS